jgi:uncharacterized membrane protein
MKKLTEDYPDTAPSTAAIAGHPIHPILVGFPIAFLVGTLFTDMAYWLDPEHFWARASLWLLTAGVVTGLLAAVFGLVDFVTIERARSVSEGWVHLIGNLTAVGLSVISILIRVGDVEKWVLPWGLGLSVLVSLILLMTGWAGGELAYRYKIGVMKSKRVAEVSEMTKPRPRTV